MKKVISSLIMIVLLFCSSNSSYANKENTELKFQEAATLYKDGRYNDAINRYETILSDGFASGAIYYNLGNSYYKNNELGKAILNYERARRIMPRDADLQANYRHAKSLIKHKPRFQDTNKVFSSVLKLTKNMTTDELAMIGLFIYFVTGTLFLLIQFLNWPKWTLLKGVLCTLFVLSMGALYINIDAQKDLAVMLEKTESKFEPTQSATTHFKLGEGVKVVVLQREGSWVKIKRKDDKIGWVKLKSLEKI